jgi:hypothetical protein
MCADSTDEDAVSRLCGPTRPNLMATDPSYGVNYDPSWRVEVDGGGRLALGKVQNDDQGDWTSALRLFSGDVAYVWHAGGHAGEVEASLHSIGFEIARKLFGRNSTSSLDGVIITGGTSRAGTPCEKARNPTGMVTERSPPFGKSKT